ncbi:NAD(P)-binding protein [Aaosphaeria arxii CBS 175.79]|uniref:NAD(P)-binding protein n=1 Tax=Aaosphaeria arxii CBS 175.79 TaxID=1450172 RepID=A0A6A5XQX3_9PLEO|nr:NAD(P)-binding protein [Aaosphaeria arxii CBS 175.79]KAF2015296.1 NAD(P)-binding protein [Aaosphaeria arxii CBS 175.79]
MASALVAITGANGTIGYHSVLHALRSGYRVRCVVRREEAVEQIKRGPSIRKFEDSIEYSIVPDNTAPGAYDDAFSGAKYVVHIAGVWPKPNYHPDNEIWHPFVQSLENVLSSAKKSGTVARIVVTQAGAGLVNPSSPSTPGTSFTKLLNEHVQINTTTAAFRPPLASPHHAYSGAKAYCMQYLQSLRKDPDLPFSIVQVIPGTVIGPSELITSSADAYAQMDRMSRALLFSDQTPRYAFGFVSVLDCARVHVEALSASNVPDYGIPDYFVAAATTPAGKTAEEIWTEVADVIAERYPKEVADGVFTIGRDRVPSEMPYRVDSTETARLLLGGRPIQGLLESVLEVTEWFVKLRSEMGA